MIFKIIATFLFLLKAKFKKKVVLKKQEIATELNLLFNKNKEAEFVINSIEWERKKLFNDSRIIPNINLGAGKNNQAEIAVATVAKMAASSVNDRKLLYNLVKNLQPKFVIELGTSLGYGTSALAFASNKTLVISIEGNPYLAEIAKENVRLFKLQNVEIISAEFDQVLPGLLNKIQAPFFAFIDGNHSYDATLKYYNYFSKIAEPNCALVFHDIHWSKGMNKAWKEISKANAVCIEDFKTGLVLFSKKQNGQKITVWRL